MELDTVYFFKGAQVGGQTWDLFDFRLFSLTSSALDHSATAPPLILCITHFYFFCPKLCDIEPQEPNF